MNALARVAGLWIPLIRPAELNPRHHFQQNHTNCKLCASTSTNLCDYRAAKQLLGVNSSISGFKCARRPTCNHLQVKPHHHLASEPQNLNTRGSIVIRVYPTIIILGRHNRIHMHTTWLSARPCPCTFPVRCSYITMLVSASGTPGDSPN